MKLRVAGIFIALVLATTVFFQNCSAGFAPIQPLEDSFANSDITADGTFTPKIDCHRPSEIALVDLSSKRHPMVPQNDIRFTSLGSVPVLSIAFDGRYIFAGTSRGLSISGDLGKTWITRTIADGLGGNEIEYIEVLDDVIYAGTNSGVSISTDHGRTFLTKSVGKIPSDPAASYDRVVHSLSIVHGTQKPVIFVVSNGGLYSSIDGGTQYELKSTQVTNPLKIQAVTSNKLIVISVASVDISNDGGATFISHPVPGIVQITKSFVDRLNGAIYISDGFQLLRSIDDGVTFNRLDISTSAILTIFANGRDLVVGDLIQGVITSNDAGATYSKAFTPGIGKSVYALAGQSDVIIAIGYDDIMISSNSGRTFSALPHHARYWNEDFATLDVDGPNITVAGVGQELLQSTDEGLTYQSSQFTVSKFPIRLLARSKETIVVDDGKNISVSSDGGVKFVVKTMQDGIPESGTYKNLFLDRTAQTFYLLANYGIARSTDLGKSFVVLPNPSGFHSELTNLIVRGKNMYAIDSKARLTSSHDGGATFRAVVLCSDRIGAIALLDNGDLYAGGSGVIYVSKDDGRSFSPHFFQPTAQAQSVTKLSVSGGTVYAATRGSGIFMSQDDGLTFGILHAFDQKEVVGIHRNDQSTFLAIRNEGLFRSN